MKPGFLLKYGLTTVILLVLIRVNVFAVSITISANTNWSAIVSGSGPLGQPSAADAITVNTGATLTNDVGNALCLSIQLGGTTAGSGNGTLAFNVGMQITVSGVVTLGNLVGGTRTGSINMSAGGTLVCQGFVLNALGTWTPGIGAVTLVADNTLPAGTSFQTFNNLSITYGTTTLGAGSTLTVAGNLFVSSTLATSGNNIVLTGTNPTVGGSGLITGTGTFTLITGTTFQTPANLTIAGQIIIPASATVTNNGTITSTSASGITGGIGTTWVNAATGTLKVAGPLLATGTLTATASGNTVNYTGATQTVKTGNYYNLFLSGSGTTTVPSGTATVSGAFTMSGTVSVTLAGALTVTGNFDLESGATLDVSASNFALNVGGNWTNNGGTFTPRNGTVTFNSAFSSFQNLFGNTPTTFWSLTVADVSGFGLNLSGNVGATINGVLTLSSGRLILGNNNVTLGSTGSLGGTFASTHMIVPEGTGLFTRIFPSGVTSFTFPVGNASGTAFYSPVALTTAGNFDNCTLNIRLQRILDPNQSPYLTNYIRKFWVLTNTGSGTPTYNITCNYDGTNDVVGTESLIQNARYTGGTWTYSGLVNAGTDQVFFNGLTTFSDFTGADPYGMKAVAVPNPICPGGSSTVTANIIGGATPYTYKWSNSFTTSSIFVTPASTFTYTVTVTDNSSITRVSSVTLTVGPITLSKSIIHNSCFCCTNGEIDLIISGGASPLSYLWSSGATTQNLTLLTKGTYTVTVTDIGGCTATTSATITQPPDPTLTGDQTICLGGSVQLTATGGTLYEWSPATGLNSTNLANPIASPTVTTTYNVEIFTPTIQSVFNGDFTLGNVGFTTDYLYVAPGGSLNPEGTYAVDHSPRSYHSSFWGIHDHTTGSGNYMIVNGATNTNKVWQQNVTVVPGNFYYFSTWVSSMNDILPAGLRFTINGVKIGPVIIAPPDTSHWIQFSTVWNSGANTNAQIEIIDTVTIAGGNDFGLDDISFAQMCSLIKQVTVNVSNMQTAIVPTPVKCRNGNDGSVALTITGGVGTYGYKWSNGSTLQNISGLTTGVYKVTVTDNANPTCKVTASTTVVQPAQALGATASQTKIVTCKAGSDGSAAVTASGGWGSYTYSWSNGQTGVTASGLSASTYTVIVTDLLGCTISATATVSEPASPLSALAGQTKAVTCMGGSDGKAAVTASGGWGGYKYNWSNGFTTTTISALSAAIYTVTVTDLLGCIVTATVTVSEPQSPLSASAGQTKAVTCKGGSDGAAQVTASGGWGSYKYKWTNGQTNATANGLSAATYTVTVTDLLGCAVTTNATVSEPLLSLSASAGQTKAVTCKGGSDGTATVTATGGWGSYIYKWNNNQTNSTAIGLSAMTYTVTVTDLLGCTKTATATVSEPLSPLSATAGQTKAVTCKEGFDGAAAVTASGGWGSYVYLWNNGQTNATANGLSAATYTVTVTDLLGCAVTATATVSEPLLPLSALAGQTKAVTCKGGSDGAAQVTANGGWGSYVYLWNNGQTNSLATALSAATYTVTVTDLLGCTTTATATVSEPQFELSAVAGQTKAVTCKGGSDGAAQVTASGGWGSYAYIWNNGQTNSLATALSAATYTVTVTDLLGCTTTATATISEPQFELSAVAGQTKAVTCKGGSDGAAQVTASGGWGSYTYIWNNGQTNSLATALSAATYTVTVTDLLGCTRTATATISEPQFELSAVAGQTKAVTCKGGSDGAAQVTASGGWGSYAYLWNNGQTNALATALSAATYTVTVTDLLGCTKTATATISEPQFELSAVAGQTKAVTCKGGSDGAAQVTASGGWGSYAYIWNNGQTNALATALSAATYTVTVTDLLGCTTTANATISEPLLTLSATAGQTKAVTCKGGSDGAAQVTASGGWGSYAYLWNNGQTNSLATALSAATYTVTVTDLLGCTKIATATISEPQFELSAVAGQTKAVTCKGGSDGAAQVTASGGWGSYAYLWNNGQTNALATALSAATYTVTVTDLLGCTTTANATISEPLLTLSATAGQTKAVTCKGGSDGTAQVTASGGWGSYTYKWNNGQTNATANGLSAATYTVTVTDLLGCTTTANATISEPLLTLSATAGQTKAVTCKGGSDGTATVTATGGWGSYAYIWNNGQTNALATALSAATYTVTVTDLLGCTKTATATISEPQFELLAVAGQTKAVTCKGGSDGTATVTATGGWGSYAYIWNNGQTNALATALSAATYTVTVTDLLGCTKTATATISEPEFELLAVAGQTKAVTCKGGSDGAAQVTATGGWGSYAYLWNNGQTNALATALSAATYTVTVTDLLGCTTTATATVSEPQFELLATAGQTKAVTCKGGSDGAAQVTATGGWGSYAYIWNNGQTNALAAALSAATYTVTVTDLLGCTKTATATISEPQFELSAVAGQTKAVTCKGGSDGAAQVTASGGWGSYAYLWNNGQTNALATALSAATYTVTVTDLLGCTKTATATISEPQFELLATAGQTKAVTCKGGSDGAAQVTASGGWGSYAYLWNNGQTNALATALSAATYTVTVTDLLGCTKTATATISEPQFELSAVAGQTKAVTCKGGSDGTATVTATGGWGSYAYLWNNGQTNALATALSAATYTVTVTDLLGCTTTATATISEPQFELLAVAGQTKAVTCKGGSDGAAQVTASGGWGSYAYIWNNGQTNSLATALSAATYTVTVTDLLGCTTTANATISEPLLTLSATAGQTKAVTCKGGSDGAATVTATGGWGSYTYKWNNGQTNATANGLSAATYTVTVTDLLGCTTTANATISEPLLTLSATAGQTKAVTCKGGSDGAAQVTASGGWGSYAYLWNNGQTNSLATALSAATYTVTVTDLLGCTTTANATISEPLLTLSATAGQTKAVTCKGGSDGAATVTATGGWGSYTYKWNNGQTNATANGLSAATYTVTVTDLLGCTTTANATISEPLLTLSATAGQTKAVTCKGGSDGAATVTATGGWGSYTYKWNNGQTNATANGLSATTYTVTVTDLLGCTTTANATISEPLLTLSATAGQTKAVTCKGGFDGAATVTATGGWGSYTYKWNNGQTNATANGLSAAIYTVTVTDLLGCTKTATATISEPEFELLAVAGQTKAVTCKGGSDGAAQVTASGGWGSYAYIWNNGQTNSLATALSAATYTVTVTDLLGCTKTATATVSEPQFELSAVAGQTKAVTCKGGSDGAATVTATGGWGSYTYKWNNGQTNATANGLSAATYTVTVTDLLGCTTTANATISEPLLTLSATAGQTKAVTCTGGSDGAATVTATGGWGSYTYKWNNGQTNATANGLSATTYTVTVTDLLGCTTTANATVSEPLLPLSATAGQTKAVTCKGGSDGAATVTATGGWGNYTYKWNNGQTNATANGLSAATYTVTVTDLLGCTTTATAMISEPQFELLAVAGQTKAVTCKGGSDGTATVTATGGWGSYAYLWNNGQTNALATALSAATYTVTVTDLLGCTTTANATISEPLLTLLATAGQTKAVTCKGGSDGAATVTATGGWGSYTYKWNNGQTNATANGLSAATYTVTVTDLLGCTTTANATISEPLLTLLATAGQTKAVTCKGGSDGAATVTATGGWGSYTYKWNNGQTNATANGLSAATYTVTVTDLLGCTTTANATISEPLLTLSATAGQTKAVTCKGGSDGAAQVTASGGWGSYAYKWNNGQTNATANGLSAATYTVTVTDLLGCTTTANATISEPLLTLSAMAGQTKAVTCKGGSDGAATVTATGGWGSYAYLWNNGQTNATANGLSASTYTVTVTDLLGCKTIAMAAVSEPHDALSATAEQTNPVTCDNNNDGTATVYPVGGWGGYTYKWNNGQTGVTVSGLSAAVYTVTVTDLNGCTTTANATISEPPPLSTIISTTPVNCNGGNNGTASVTATGGNGEYSYLWNTEPLQTTQSISSLAAGSYIVTVTDSKGCSGTNTATVSEPQIITAVINTTPVICFGGNNGTAIVSATGGNEGYTYRWSTNPVSTTQTISALSAGSYTVTVTDSKGCIGTATTTITQPVQIIVNAGPDQVYCNASNTFLIGSDPTPGTGNWTMEFGPNTPVIFPANSSIAIAAGLIPGIYKFIYTVTIPTAEGFCSYTDTMMVTNYHLPTPAFAGTDQQLCKTQAGFDSTLMAGNLPLFGSGLWTQMSGPNTANIVNPGNPHTKVKHLIDGIYIFRWSITSGICDVSTSDVQVEVHIMPVAHAGPNDTICGGSSFTLVHSSVSGDYTLLTWLTSGTGYFNDPNILHPTYVPSAADIAAGQVTLALKVTGYDPCGIVIDQMVLHIVAPPVANAGPDASICETSNFCLCGASAFNYIKLWWTTTGTGTFNDSTLLKPIYTPSPGDIAGGCVKLVLHLTGNPPCGDVTDTMELCIRRIPIVYAGPDTTICSQGTYTINLSTEFYATGLKWRTSGTGTFDNDTILHPTYKPGLADLAAGHVTLTLLGIACSPCPNDSDSMVLSFSYPPIVHAYVVTHVNCFGENNGSVTVTVTGGRMPYYYLWSDPAQQTTQTATGLYAGTYTVTVTDYYSCTATSSTTVTEPPLLTALSTITHVSCYTYSDGSITLTANGGTPGYTYLWSTGATTKDISGLSADTYTVTVTDSHGCTATLSNVVTQPPQWGPPCITGLTSVCQGSTTQYCACPVELGFPADWTFQWTVIGGTLVCCPHNHCITVRWDNCTIGQVCLLVTRGDGCQITLCINVTVNPVPQPDITGPAIVSVGYTGTYCTPDVPGDIYNWSVVGGTVVSGMGSNCIDVLWNTNCNMCQGLIIVNELNAEGCCGVDTLFVTILPGAGNLTGYVTYKNAYNTGLNGVSLVLRDSVSTIVGTTTTGPKQVTNEPGFYSFSNVPDGSYSLSGSFNGTWGGNNATDALIIELYTVHSYNLNGLNRIVGDVNVDLTVNSTDALWVKLRTVGMVNYYPAGDWKVQDSTFALTSSAMINLNALCEGDVNGSYIPTGFKEASFLSAMEDGTMTVQLGEPFDYEVRSGRVATLGAMTMFLGYDQSRFEVEKVVTELEGMKYLIRDGKLAFAWSNTNPMVVNDGDPIIVLRMKVKEPISTPAKVFEVEPGSEFAGMEADRFDNFDLRMSDLKTIATDNTFSLGNYPNPFSNTTTIVYRIPEQAHVKLLLMNMYGEVLHTLTDAGQAAGSYQVKVNPLDYNLVPGVYLYRIQVDGVTNTYDKINKMVFTR